MRASGESLKAAGECAEVEAQAGGDQKASAQGSAATDKAVGEAERSANVDSPSQAGRGPSSGSGTGRETAVSSAEKPVSKL